jgi:hypothetical protein
MDPFDRTFLPAALDAGLPMTSITRQLPLLRSTFGLGHTVVLVSQCSRLDRPMSTDHVLVLSRDRLVITTESRLFRGPRVHLNAAIAELRKVRWEPDPRLTALELHATAANGVRERFLLKVRTPGTVWHVDATLGYVFHPSRINGAPVRRLSPV